VDAPLRDVMRIPRRYGSDKTRQRVLPYAVYQMLRVVYVTDCEILKTDAHVYGVPLTSP